MAISAAWRESWFGSRSPLEICVVVWILLPKLFINWVVSLLVLFATSAEWGQKSLTGRLGLVNIHLLKSHLYSLLFLVCMQKGHSMLHLFCPPTHTYFSTQKGHSMCAFILSADTYFFQMFLAYGVLF